VECKARNPCYTHIRQQNPEAGDGYVSLIIRRTFSVTLRHIARVPLRFTTCLWSAVLSGLAKHYV